MKQLKVVLTIVFLANIVLLTSCTTPPKEPIDPLPPIGDSDNPKGPEIGIDGPGGGNKPGDFFPQGETPKSAYEWEVDASVKLPIIYFSYDKHQIGTSERKKIEETAKYMQDNPSAGLIIDGHCDERGGVEYNRTLGQKRAMAVQNYLVELGISEDRMRTNSFGEERPAVEGKTPEARSKNRRAELHAAKMK